MNDARFDAMTRSAASGTSTRRAALHLLAETGMGLLVVRFALSEDAEATPKKRRRRSEARRDGALQAEGKGKRKRGKDKGKDKDGPKPRDCGPGKKPCPDGGCVVEALCCPGQRMCAGGSCQTGCCADEWECPGGACVDPLEECCPGQRRCDGNVCIPEDACCPEATAPLCTDECEDIVCANGELVCEPVPGCESPPPPSCEDEGPCRPGYWRQPNSCACQCPAGSVDCGFFCCPADDVCLTEGGFRTWCLAESGATRCPIGWTPYRDSGLCYPGTPPS